MSWLSTVRRLKVIDYCFEQKTISEKDDTKLVPVSIPERKSDTDGAKLH